MMFCKIMIFITCVCMHNPFYCSAREETSNPSSTKVKLREGTSDEVGQGVPTAVVAAPEISTATTMIPKNNAKSPDTTTNDEAASIDLNDTLNESNNLIALNAGEPNLEDGDKSPGESNPDPTNEDDVTSTTNEEDELNNTLNESNNLIALNAGEPNLDSTAGAVAEPIIDESTKDSGADPDDLKNMQGLSQEAAKSSVILRNVTTPDKMFGGTASADINATVTRVKGYGTTNSRLTMQTMYARLEKMPAKNIKVFKAQFAHDLIQMQCDNNLGIDPISFQSLYSFKDDIQNPLIDYFASDTGKYADLFNPTSAKTSVEKLQLIAQMNDDVMNLIHESVVFDANKNLVQNTQSSGIAHFVTTYDAQGNYTANITFPGKDSSSAISAVFDLKGNPVSKSFGVGSDMFTTNFRSGWFYGNYKTTQTGSATLSDTTGAIIDNVSLLTSAAAYFKANMKLALQDARAAITKENAIKAAKTATKVSLIAGKQAVIYTVSSFLPFHIPLASAALLLPVVKIISLIPAVKNPDGTLKTYTGYQFTGYSSGDAVALTVAMKAIDLAVGDKGQVFGGVFSGGKPLLSMQGDRVFRKGTWISNALQNVQGKQSEAENELEMYVDAIPLVLQTAYKPLQALFPKKLGGTILSQADLAKASSSSIQKATPVKDTPPTQQASIPTAVPVS